MNTKISDADALAASLRQIADAQYTRRQRFNGRLPADVQEVIRMAADHLAADAVPVACIHEWRTTGGGMGKAQRHLVCMKCGIDRSYPKPAALNEVPTMDDAVAAGDGTLHGAIDHWQDRALKAEAALNEVSGNSGELGGEQQALDIDDVRELFEKWAEGRDLTPDTWGVGSYASPYVDDDWLV